MAQPPLGQGAPNEREAPSGVRRAALLVTVGALIASAVLGGIFIIVGGQPGIAGRAWLTLAVVIVFALAAMLDGSAAGGPNRWYLTASTLLNVFLLLIALLKLWNGPLQPAGTADGAVWGAQFGRFVGAVAVVRAALLVSQLYIHDFVAGSRNSLARGAGACAVVFVSLTALVFVVPLSFPNLHPIGISGYADWWWRIAAATTLVAAVCVVIPLIVRIFEAKPRRAARPPLAPAPQWQQPTPDQAQYRAQAAARASYEQQQEAWREYERQKREWEAYLAATQAGAQASTTPRVP